LKAAIDEFEVATKTPTTLVTVDACIRLNT
jgi:hypothetical protein